MKRGLLVAIAFLLVVSVVFIGCAQPAPAPAPTPAPKPAPAPTPAPAPKPAPAPAPKPAPAPAPKPAPVKPIVWRYQTYQTSASEAYQEAERMSARVEERSGGRLKIEVGSSDVWGFKGFDAHRPCGEGLIEIAQPGCGGITEEVIYQAFSLPLFAGVTAETAAAAGVSDILKAWTALKPELEPAAERMNVKLLWTSTSGVCQYHTTKPLNTLEDWQGLKVRCWSPIDTAYAEKMGGVPHVIPYAEAYTSLATGVVEANPCGPLTVLDMKWWEVTPFFNIWGGLPFNAPVFVNLDKFNELPADLQDILVEEAAKSEEAYWPYFTTAVVDAYKVMEEKGMTIVYPSAEDLAVSDAAYLEVTEEWANKTGPEAKAAVEKILKALGK